MLAIDKQESYTKPEDKTKGLKNSEDSKYDESKSNQWPEDNDQDVSFLSINAQ